MAPHRIIHSLSEGGVSSEHLYTDPHLPQTTSEILDEGGRPKSKCFQIEEIIEGGYNLDLCGFPNEVKEILPPDELIAQFKERRAALDSEMDSLLGKIEELLGHKVV